MCYDDCHRGCRTRAGVASLWGYIGADSTYSSWSQVNSLRYGEVSIALRRQRKLTRRGRRRIYNLTRSGDRSLSRIELSSPYMTIQISFLVQTRLAINQADRDKQSKAHARSCEKQQQHPWSRRERSIVVVVLCRLSQLIFANERGL